MCLTMLLKLFSPARAAPEVNERTTATARAEIAIRCESRVFIAVAPPGPLARLLRIVYGPGLGLLLLGRLVLRLLVLTVVLDGYAGHLLEAELWNAEIAFQLTQLRHVD